MCSGPTLTELEYEKVGDWNRWHAERLGIMGLPVQSFKKPMRHTWCSLVTQTVSFHSQLKCTRRNTSLKERTQAMATRHWKQYRQISCKLQETCLRVYQTTDRESNATSTPHTLTPKKKTTFHWQTVNLLRGLKVFPRSVTLLALFAAPNKSVNKFYLNLKAAVYVSVYFHYFH